MYFKQVIRSLHVTRSLFATDKSALGALRKKTGYTFSNCKKALELHNNDLAKAEHWLKEQAQTLGWSKATKLEGRSTKQGLVGVLVQNNIGAMVEVNCETDFVARNKNFREFVENVSRACVQHVSTMPTNDKLSKIDFESETLKSLKFTDGKSLGDHLALMIGTVGENASLRRATCFKTTNSIALAGFAHPATEIDSLNTVQLGKYGTIVALKPEDNELSTEFQKNICQHIVGMNPRKIGNREQDKPAAVKDDETSLLFQEYLLDPSITVDEFLAENKVKVVDFQRFECGETVADADKIVNIAQAASN